MRWKAFKRNFKISPTKLKYGERSNMKEKEKIMPLKMRTSIGIMWKGKIEAT